MKKFAAVGLITLTIAGVAAACIHPPKTYEGSWEETSQQALIFHRGDREDLILKVSYKMTPRGDLPAAFGWVIPVPSKPDEYGVVDASVFKDVFKISDMYREAVRAANGERFKGQALSAEPAAGVKVVDHQVVGEFDITAIAADGKKAAELLNKWLSSYGFRDIPAKDLDYYTNLGWTFLAVKVDPSKGAQKVEASGELNSLRISFECEDVVYPLKLSASEGAFDVVTYVISEKPLERSQWLERNGFIVTTIDPDSSQRSSVKLLDAMLPVNGNTELSKLRATVEKGKTGKFESLYLTTYKAADVNSKDNPIQNWKTDFVAREQRK